MTPNLPGYDPEELDETPMEALTEDESTESEHTPMLSDMSQAEFAVQMGSLMTAVLNKEKAMKSYDANEVIENPWGDPDSSTGE